MKDVSVAYLNAGRSYELAALDLMKSDTQVAFPDLPVRQCLLLAVELYLKSFLIHTGMSSDDVEKLRHKVGKSAELAVERGLEVGVEDQQLLHMVSDEKTLINDRYVVPSPEPRRVPNLPPLVDLVDELYQMVGQRLVEAHPNYALGETLFAPKR